jgi:hypothetical protein
MVWASLLHKSLHGGGIGKIRLDFSEWGGYTPETDWESPGQNSTGMNREFSFARPGVGVYFVCGGFSHDYS